ncbi:MAG: T9SS type A sorting domain-containing protein [Flavobacteriales bacterium]|nr:T9SS type A sorting domain-containing protein [Flavobacteriales bacterium]
MAIEIHGMAYAYDSIQNYGLNHTIFVNYKIVNRSNNDYTDTYIGIDFDPDVGASYDDFIESDVKRGMVIGYNGTSVDGAGAPDHYGAFPPAQSMTILKGPLMDSDGIDNAAGSCDASLNGSGFGDGIIDNETIGMTHFIYYCNPATGGCPGSTQGDPSTAIDHYNFLTSIWKDGTQMVYGGNGHINNCTSCEPANFMFPNVSDTCGYGIGGITPGDTVPWNEQSAGNPASDRRGLASVGPFTFEAGDTIEFDIAYVYARDTVNPDPYGSVILLKKTSDSVDSIFYKIILPADSIELAGSVLDQMEVATFILYPNPADNIVKIDISSDEPPLEYQIYDLTGRLLQSGKVDEIGTIAIETLPHGVFIIDLMDQERVFRAKFVKL